MQNNCLYKTKILYNIFEQCQRDMKETWATLSDILNRNTKKSLPDTMTTLCIVGWIQARLQR